MALPLPLHEKECRSLEHASAHLWWYIVFVSCLLIHLFTDFTPFRLKTTLSGTIFSKLFVLALNGLLFIVVLKWNYPFGLLLSALSFLHAKSCKSKYISYYLCINCFFLSHCYISNLFLCGNILSLHLICILFSTQKLRFNYGSPSKILILSITLQHLISNIFCVPSVCLQVVALYVTAGTITCWYWLFHILIHTYLLIYLQHNIISIAPSLTFFEFQVKIVKYATSYVFLTKFKTYLW